MPCTASGTKWIKTNICQVNEKNPRCFQYLSLLVMIGKHLDIMVSMYEVLDY